MFLRKQGWTIFASTANVYCVEPFKNRPRQSVHCQLNMFQNYSWIINNYYFSTHVQFTLILLTTSSICKCFYSKFMLKIPQILLNKYVIRMTVK